jgi:hypothetical protein
MDGELGQALHDAANGDFVRSLIAQPMGCVLAVLTAATMIGCLHAAATGWRIDRLLAAMVRPRVLWVFAGLFLAAWGYKLMVV